MKRLGLDVGEKTIGVSTSDMTGLIASPVKTIKRTGNKQAIGEILDCILSEQAEEVIVGLPKNMKGDLGPQAEKTLQFVKQLEKKITYSTRLEKNHVKVIMWDERLTTKAAHRTLIDSGLNREKRKKVVDQLAAVYILQGYLDHVREEG